MIFLFLFISLYLAESAELNQGIVINTSISNTSMTLDSISAYGYFDVYPYSIELSNLSYTNGELAVNITSIVNLTESNSNIDISAFPYLLSHSTTRKKYIGSNLSNVQNATVIISTNCTNITGISYSSIGYSKSYPSWSCISNRIPLDIIGIVYGNNNILEISANDSIIEEGPPVSGGGGSQSTGSKINYDFSLDPKMLKISLKHGEISEYEITINNIGDAALTVLFDPGKLGKYVKTFDNIITLGFKEAKKITLVFSSSEKDEPDVIVGNIMFNSDYVSRALPVIFEINSKEPLFDVQISIPSKSKETTPGSEIPININITNLGDIMQVDVEIEYLIKDMEDNIIDSSKETLAVEKSLQFIKPLQLSSSIKEGTYVAYVKVNYAGKTAVASENFEIKINAIPMGASKNTYLTTIIIVMLSLLILVILIYVIKKMKHDEDGSSKRQRIIRKIKHKKIKIKFHKKIKHKKIR